MRIAWLVGILGYGIVYLGCILIGGILDLFRLGSNSR